MIIGIMGGVGSGKSTVLSYLQDKYNAHIIQSDIVAKEIMTPGHRIYEQLLNNFPDEVSKERIDIDKLSKTVFNDGEKLKLLNSITHPGTIREIIARIESSTSKLIVVESALLLEAGLDKCCDELWFIYCEKEERIKRLIENRGYSREKAEKIIQSQMSDEELNSHADEFIDNTQSFENAKEKIDLILSISTC